MNAGEWITKASISVMGGIFLVVPLILAHSSGAPTGHTGSQKLNEPSCTQCHAGTANSGPGKARLTGLPENYVPGQTYNLRVTLEQAGQKRWGFELASRTKSKIQAGTLTAGADGNSQIFLSEGIQFITHTSSGTRAGTADGPVNFDFSWKAPDSDLGEIYVSLAGNAANNSGTNSGDFIYTLEKSLLAQPGSGAGQTEPQISSVFPNSGPVSGGTPILILGKDFSPSATITIGGQPASNIVVLEDSRISAATPATSLAGPVDIVVNSGGRSTTLNAGYTYENGTPAQPVSKALIVPYVIDTDDFRTNLGMSNLTGSQVEVTVSYADFSGTVLGAKSYSVPANGLLQISNIIRTLLDSTQTSQKEGYLILDPSTEGAIAAYATPIDNSTQDSSVIQGTRGKSAHLILPTSTSTGLFKTSLTLINDSEVNNQVEIKLRNPNGEVQATKNVILAPYGSFSTLDLHSFLGVSNVFGPVELQSLESTPKPIAAVSKVYTGLTTSAGKTGTASAFFLAEPLDH